MPALNRLLLISLFASSSMFCLFVVRLIADPETSVEPLSNSRYGNTAFWGRLAFFLLIAMGWIYAAISFLAEDKSTFVVACTATILIIFISLTPTMDGDHMLAANGLMILLFSYYAYRLYSVQSVWFLIHIAVPVVIILTLVSLNRFNFGMVQKVTILYLVTTVFLDGLTLSGISIGGLDWLGRREPQRKTVKVKIRSPRVIYRRPRRDQQLESSLS